MIGDVNLNQMDLEEVRRCLAQSGVPTDGGDGGIVYIRASQRRWISVMVKTDEL